LPPVTLVLETEVEIMAVRQALTGSLRDDGTPEDAVLKVIWTTLDDHICEHGGYVSPKVLVDKIYR
jgi:hypothetical protein